MKLNQVKELLREKKELAENHGGQWLEDYVTLCNMVRNGHFHEEEAKEMKYAYKWITNGRMKGVIATSKDEADAKLFTQYGDKAFNLGYLGFNDL